MHFHRNTSKLFVEFSLSSLMLMWFCELPNIYRSVLFWRFLFQSFNSKLGGCSFSNLLVRSFSSVLSPVHSQSKLNLSIIKGLRFPRENKAKQKTWKFVIKNSLFDNRLANKASLTRYTRVRWKLRTQEDAPEKASNAWRYVSLMRPLSCASCHSRFSMLYWLVYRSWAD